VNQIRLTLKLNAKLFFYFIEPQVNITADTPTEFCVKNDKMYNHM